MKPPYSAFEAVLWWNTLSWKATINIKAVVEYFKQGAIREIEANNLEDAKTWLQEADLFKEYWYAWRK